MEALFKLLVLFTVLARVCLRLFTGGYLSVAPGISRTWLSTSSCFMFLNDDVQSPVQHIRKHKRHLGVSVWKTDSRHDHGEKRLRPS